jgi:hypothetical protein
MDLPSFNAQTPPKLPLLIIDKTGILGGYLAAKLRDSHLIVLVSGRDLTVSANIIHIPFKKKIPSIPDNVYSHMFVFYNGEEEIADMLPALARKAGATRAKLFFITHLSYSSKPLFHFLNRQEYHGVETVLYGDIFDNSLTVTNSISRFIAQARKTRSLSVPEQGLGYLYPVHMDDVIDGIVKSAFKSERRTLLFLFPAVSYTQLSIARILQKIDSLMKIDFARSKHMEPDYYIPSHGVYFFPTYNLEARLRTITLTDETVKQTRRIRIRKRRENNHAWAITFISILCFLLVPLFVAVLADSIGELSAMLALRQAQSGNIDSALTFSSFANNAFDTAHYLNGGLLLLKVIGQDDNFAGSVTQNSRIALTETQFFSAVITLKRLYTGKSHSPKTDFLTALTSLKNGFISLQKLRAENDLPPEVLAKLSQVSGLISILENTSDALPALLGFSGKKTYLILFQNNMELRPGGGFIGSYGIAGIDKGTLTSFTVSDVYDADGKLTTPIAPPFALQRYLGISHWFLRDSNYDPDFEKDAAVASQFLTDETGQHVDGVIAIDTDFIRNILGDFGPLYVPDYHIVITPDNFYQITESESENGFFPGSTQKKDFLQEMFATLLIHVQQEKSLPVVSIMKTINDSIAQKHLLFAFPGQSVQKLFTVNGLSDSLWDDRVSQGNTFNDTFGLIDANLGANKANLYVKRVIEQGATVLSNGDIQEKATVSYANTSSPASPFGGEYKDYVRFIVPKNAMLQAVSVDDQVMPTTPAVTDPSVFTQTGFIPPSQLEVEQSQEEGKTFFGFLLLVPMGSSKKVSITYTIARAVDLTQPVFSYDLRLYKQAGTQSDPYVLLFDYPSAFTPVTPGPATDVGGKLIYDSSLSQDMDMTMEFTKK